MPNCPEPLSPQPLTNTYVRASLTIYGNVAFATHGESRTEVLGSGDHTYEAYHDWGELPAGLRYGNTHGVVEDSQGRIYVHHTVHATSESSDSMVVFDAKGNETVAINVRCLDNIDPFAVPTKQWDGKSH